MVNIFVEDIPGAAYSPTLNALEKANEKVAFHSNISNCGEQTKGKTAKFCNITWQDGEFVIFLLNPSFGAIFPGPLGILMSPHGSGQLTCICAPDWCKCLQFVSSATVVKGQPANKPCDL